MEAIQAHRSRTGKPAASFIVSGQIKGSRLAKSIDQALSDLDIPVLRCRTSRRVAYELAGGMGLTVQDLVGQARAAEEVESLTQEIITLLQ
ncbi:MAG: hypothetical protein OXG94_09810 [Bacteroidetes bacterium]|nr:hypothetical protein [Bacteroidota bacterium]